MNQHYYLFQKRKLLFQSSPSPYYQQNKEVKDNKESKKQNGDAKVEITISWLKLIW